MLKEIRNFHDTNETNIKNIFFLDEFRNLQGEYKEWYENGQMNCHLSYLDNKLNGEQIAWHKNGNLQFHYFVHDFSLHGEYKSWDKDGHLTIHSFYSKGKLITDEVKNMVLNTYKLTEEEKMFIKLSFGIPLIENT